MQWIKVGCVYFDLDQVVSLHEDSKERRSEDPDQKVAVPFVVIGLAGSGSIKLDGADATDFLHYFLKHRSVEDLARPPAT